MSGAGRRRRVLVIAWWYPSELRPQLGTFVRDHARAAARDSDVVVIALEAADGLGPARFDVADSSDDGLRTLRVRHSTRAAPLGYAPGLAMAARRLAREGFRPDVVHAHVHLGGVLAAPLARLWRAPLVLSEHFSGFQRPGMHPLETLSARVALRAAAIVCPPSESLRRALAAQAPRARFRIVPNVVDTKLFHPPDRPRPDGRILFVGNLEDVKGIPHLLDAVSRIPGPVVLDLVGGGPRRPTFEAQARRLGLDPAIVRFHGPLPKPAVAEAMRRATVLVLPSLTETFGLAAAEALASGVPVVASRAGALPELVDPAVGLLVPPADATALAGALEQMLERHRSYGAAALALSVQRFSPEAVAGAWSDVYGLVSTSSRRGT